MVTVGFLIRYEAKPGKEADVERSLKAALATIQKEPATTAWFAIRLGPSTFGIFDAYSDEEGRQTRLAVGGTLLAEKASELFAQPPLIEQVDILERQHLITVETSTEDRRVRVITLTTQGYQKVNDALPRWKQAQTQMMSLLGPQQSRALLVDAQTVMERVPFSA